MKQQLITTFVTTWEETGDCDREMVKSLDDIPYGEMPKWGSTARFLINTKQKLGLGLNARRR